MGLEPNLSEILNGTEFNYTLRDTDYRIRLSVDDYEMQTDRFSGKAVWLFIRIMKKKQS